MHVGNWKVPEIETKYRKKVVFVWKKIPTCNSSEYVLFYTFRVNGQHLEGINFKIFFIHVEEIILSYFRNHVPFKSQFRAFTRNEFQNFLETWFEIMHLFESI